GRSALFWISDEMSRAPTRTGCAQRTPRRNQTTDNNRGAITMDRLKHKVALVFGGGPNIGGTIAHFLAREGARVVVSDLQESVALETVKFIKSRGYEAEAATGSALVESDVAHVVEQALDRWGHLDVVVNMAGKIHWGSV